MKRTASLLFCLVIVAMAAKGQINNVIPKLQSYNQRIFTEQVYVQTDRDVYYQEDTIWFKAYIRKKMYLNESTLSKVFKILLVNSKGDLINSAKYIFFDSQSKGQFLIDKNITEGFYYIIAYTSWMENFSTDKVFTRKIYIKNESVEGYKIVPAFDKKAYNPGDTVNIQMKCYDNLNRVSNDLKYNYKIISNDKILKTGNSFEKNINCVLDTSLSSFPVIKIRDNKNKFFRDSIIEIPINRNVEVTFFPEGGHCINGLMGLVAYKATYSNGLPAQIYG